MSNDKKFEKLNEALKGHESAMALPLTKGQYSGSEDGAGRRSESAKITLQNKAQARSASSVAAFTAAHPDSNKFGPKKPAAPKPPAQPAKPKALSPIKPLQAIKPK